MSLPVRLGLFYSAIFVGTGAASPYMPVWFAERGLSGAQIGLILSLPMLARALTAPLLAVWADSFRLRRTALIFMSLGVAVAYALMALPLGFLGWTLVWFAASSAFSTMSPLTDVIVLARARRDGFNYGWPRGIGSVAFIVANVVMGAVLTWGSPELVLVWITAAVSLTALGARYLLPPDPVHEEGVLPAPAADRFAGLGALLRDPAFMTAALACGLIQSSHAFYYSFSTLTWKQQGVPEGLTGVLWGVGVAAEVAFLWWMEPWRRRIGPRNLLMLGGGAALIRWTAYAFAPPLWLVFPLQALHVFSYAATFIASLQLVERLSTPRNASAAQAVNSALSGGVLAGLATMASGPLFDRYG
ncbi:MAG: MFS transporter, partial [Phenylobacterium sp.]|nr:MFS transporter [Phenylobacterium sp.]